MSSDKTEHQSSDELEQARDLSLDSARPPGSVPGYTLQSFLGSGAYGQVWSATNQKTGGKVAVKFYTRGSREDFQLLAREVEKLVVLGADVYVVRLLDVGWDADPPFYVMDYIEHGSLEDRLNEQKSMPAAEAIDLFQQVATGMMHLHGKGILHCDLKPGNILLDQDGKPRVADFGQSRLISEASSALGTLFFMAPEQADLEAVPDARWDVYGLGALLFSMLTGRPPYYSKDLAKAIEVEPDISARLSLYKQSLLAAPKPTEHRRVAGVDRGMADIIDRCIAANPKTRFSSIQSVLLALRQREAARARRPLMLLGLLGPLLLMGVMSFFGWQAYQRVVGDTDQAISEKAAESNLFAAQLAARSAAERIKVYFRVVGQLARDEEFLEKFDALDKDGTLLQLRHELGDPARNDGVEFPEFVEIRTQFKEDALRQELQSFLELRMKDPNDEYPLAASWFLCDRFGNQVGSVFPEGQENTTLGKNYAYRSYFTGLLEDLKEVSENPDDRVITERAHLSAPFKSEQTNTWKVAFSTPIQIDGEFRGIVACTVEMGRFLSFKGVDQQYAMLVDSRRDPKRSAIIEHPAFRKLTLRNERVPKEMAETTIDLSEVKSSNIYRDPIGKSPKGEAYDREAIFASAPVEVESYEDAARDIASESGPKNSTTGLHVLAVEDYDSVIQPAHLLGQRLGWLAMLAATFLLAVAIGMWLMVNRMLKDSRQRLSRAFAPISNSSLQDMETIAAAELKPKTAQRSAQKSAD